MVSVKERHPVCAAAIVQGVLQQTNRHQGKQYASAHFCFPLIFMAA
jgi:formate dehydrogenase maturation protein FdhE